MCKNRAKGLRQSTARVGIEYRSRAGLCADSARCQPIVIALREVCSCAVSCDVEQVEQLRARAIELARGGQTRPHTTLPKSALKCNL